MKKTYLSRMLLLVPFFFLLAGCQEMPEGDDGVTAKPIVLTKSQQTVLNKGNDFSFNLLKETYRENLGGNLFLSPMGVTIVSSMLANGANGPTYDEIVAAIGMKGSSLDQINECYATMVDALVKVDSSVGLSLANSIWLGNGLSLRKKFSNNMAKVFDAESFTVDFGAPGTLDQVNAWCSKKTSGLIPKMFEQLSAQVRMLLINALYFKGDWVYTFPEADTKEDVFVTSTGSVRMPFMHLTAELEGYQDETVSVVKMPYGNGAFMMEAVAPSGDFDAFLSGLSLEKLQQWDRAAKKTTVILSFPKFTAEFDTEEMLVPVLNRLGMVRAFGSMADFSNMTDESLYVDKFRQKTYVSVDEKGTKAAAVTVAEMRKNVGGPSQDVLTLNFNRPFVYLIRETSTGAILFIGTKVK